MKRFHKLCKTAALLLCGILALGGCGKDGDKVGSGSGKDAVSDTEQLMAYKKDIRYLPQFTDTSAVYDAFASVGVGFSEDTFYLIKRELSGYIMSLGQLIARNPDTGEETVLVDGTDTDERLVTAALPGDGSVIVLFGRGDTEYRLCGMDSGGNETFSREYTDFPVIGQVCQFAADSTGRSCLLVQKTLYLFDEEGRKLGDVSLEGRTGLQIARSGSGAVYLYEYETKQMTPIDFGAAGLGEASCTVPVDWLNAIAPSGEADFLICDRTTVYRFSCADGALTPLFDLQDSQILDGGDIDTLGETEDGRIFLFSNNGEDTTEIAILTPTPVDECPVKEEVTIGTVDAGSNLLESIAKFNRQSEECAVSVLNYGIGGRSREDALAALKLDISIGKGPDICVLDEFIDPEELFPSGCFEDLTPWLDGSRRYQKEDFIPKVLEIYTYDDTLMAVPNYFYLRTLTGRTDVVGDKMGWNMDDVKELIRSHPDVKIFDTNGNKYMMNVCMRNMMDVFVDFENGKAAFDSPEFVELLDFVKSLPDNSAGNRPQVYDYSIPQERTLLSSTDIGMFTDLQQTEAILGGEITCIGYPSPDRSPDCIIRGRGAYAISAASQDKESAWKFIEWTFSAQENVSASRKMFRGGFPTRKEAYERELSEAMDTEETDKGSSIISGAIVKYHSTTQEEAELLDFLLECASPEKSVAERILDIINEEAAYVFDGSKSAEEVAEVTQNRVQLYLDEK